MSYLFYGAKLTNRENLILNSETACKCLGVEIQDYGGLGENGRFGKDFKIDEVL